MVDTRVHSPTTGTQTLDSALKEEPVPFSKKGAARKGHSQLEESVRLSELSGLLSESQGLSIL